MLAEDPAVLLVLLARLDHQVAEAQLEQVGHQPAQQEIRAARSARPRAAATMPCTSSWPSVRAYVRHSSRCSPDMWIRLGRSLILVTAFRTIVISAWSTTTAQSHVALVLALVNERRLARRTHLPDPPARRGSDRSSTDL